MAYNDRIPSHTHYITPGYSTCAFAKQSRTPHPFFHIYTVGMCGVRYQLGTSYYGYLLIYSVVEKTQITCQAGDVRPGGEWVGGGGGGGDQGFFFC